MYIYSFEKLEVWRESVDLAKSIYRLLQKFPDTEKFNLANQLKRASLSISSNLAEGTSRLSEKEKAYFTSIAFGSTMEVLNQLIISYELQYITKEEYEDLRMKISSISNKLNSLRKSQLKQ